METEGLDGEVVNIGSRDEVTISELAKIILSIVDSASEITHKPLPKDDPKRRQPDISKANELLGWEPEISLHEGMTRTIRYFRQNQ
ncbi:hypothetical protein EXE44_18790 [Halorubrum sp. SS7]|nr:hypothetical protein EXE44_18790 [Halorubrum sp. SS7]